MDGAHAVDLLSAREGEVDVAIGGEALGDQGIGGEENTVDGALGVQRPAPPETTVLNDAVKGGLIPAALVHGHYVVVGHHDGGRALGLSLPTEQETAVGETGELADLKNVGVQGRELGNELFKLGIILQGGIHVGHGLADHQLAEGVHGGVLVEVHGGSISLGLGLGLEGNGTDEDDRQEHDQGEGDQNGEGVEQQHADAQSEPFVHVTALPSCRGSAPRSP